MLIHFLVFVLIFDVLTATRQTFVNVCVVFFALYILSYFKFPTVHELHFVTYSQQWDHLAQLITKLKQARY